MFNAEKLLGKVLHEVIGTGHHKKKHKSSLLGSLSSGAGLMTVIGLGVGAMEIFKDKQRQAAAGGQQPQSYPQPPHQPPPQPHQPDSHPNWSAPAPNWSTPAQQAPPPLPPQMPSSNAVPPQGPPAVAAVQGNTEELAIRLIQVMIAAAHADGTLDATEEQAILERAGKAGLSQEERMFLLDELHKPKSVSDLTAGITDPSVAKTMYILAANTIAIDTEAERGWLDQLAAALGISKAVQNFIEEQG